MAKYIATVERRTSAFLDIEVEADSEDEAILQAMEQAGNNEFPVGDISEYDVHYVVLRLPIHQKKVRSE